jgi:hypothetical protein
MPETGYHTDETWKQGEIIQESTKDFVRLGIVKVNSPVLVEADLKT